MRHGLAAAGCRSVAFTYNDPVIFAEYAMDAADACHALGIKTVAVTAGYIGVDARREFYAKMDAANVDLKAFSDAFYVTQTGEVGSVGVVAVQAPTSGTEMALPTLPASEEKSRAKALSGATFLITWLRISRAKILSSKLMVAIGVEC